MATKFPPVAIDLGALHMQHLLSWRKDVHREHMILFKHIAYLGKKMKEHNRELCRHKEDKEKAAEETTELHRLTKELKDYRYKLWICDRTYRPMERVLNAAIEPYSRSSCIGLTKNTYTSFPREVRDMIYEYLLDDGPLGIVCLVAQGKPESIKCCEEHEWGTVEGVHFNKPEFVYAGFLAELKEMAIEIHARQVQG